MPRKPAPDEIRCQGMTKEGARCSWHVWRQSKTHCFAHDETPMAAEMRQRAGIKGGTAEKETRTLQTHRQILVWLQRATWEYEHDKIDRAKYESILRGAQTAAALVDRIRGRESKKKDEKLGGMRVG